MLNFVQIYMASGALAYLKVVANANARMNELEEYKN